MRIKTLVLFTVLTLCLKTIATWNQVSGSNTFPRAFNSNAASNKMIAGMIYGGWWMTEDSGLNWEPINERILDTEYFLPTRVQFLDADADTIILSLITWNPGTENHTYYSTDGGITWTFLDEVFSGGATGTSEEHLIIDEGNHNIMYYINRYYSAVSDDFGETWDYFIIDGSYYPKNSLIMDSEGNLLFSGIYLYDNGFQIGGVCRSADTCQTWESILPLFDLWGLEEAEVMQCIELSNGDLIATVNYTLPEIWETECLVISTDGGDTWERGGGDLPPRYIPWKIIEDPFIPGKLFIIGQQKYGLYASNDYGRSWFRCLNGLPENVSVCGDLTCNQYGGEIFTGVMGYGLYKTVDHGESWEQVPIPPLGYIGWISAQDSSIYYTDKSYRMWRTFNENVTLTEISTPMSPDTLVMMRPVSYSKNDTLVAGIRKRPFTEPVDLYQMSYSYDGGITWELRPFLSFDLSYINTYQDENIVRLMTVDNDTVYFSDDIGETWAAIPTSMPSVTFTDQNAEDIFTANSAVISKYNPVTNEWTSLNYPGPNINRILAVFGDEIYIASWEYPNPSHCYYYSGESWEMRGEIDWSIDLCTLIPTAEDTILFTTGGDTNLIWFSDDGGFTWQEEEYSFPFPGQTFKFWSLEYDPLRELIWAGTGAGLCYLELGQLEAEGPLIFNPVEFASLEVYPNPFNASTAISFKLQAAGEIELAVYNIQGQRVWGLGSGVWEAGTHEVVWDAEGLASGVYLVRLTVEGMTDRNVCPTRKVVLVK